MEDLLLAHNAQIILGVVFGGVAMVMLIESFAPWRVVSGAPLARWANNLALTTLDYLLLLGLSPFLAIWIAIALGIPQTGLLKWLGAGPWLGFLVTVLCLDLLGYWLHRAFHALPWLWRIHAVHHSDVEFDATTAHRHHPFEPLISVLVAMPVVMALGAEPILLLAYNVLRLAVAALSHGNFSFPPPMERIARLVFVTPDFHRLHHAAERRYTDSNYSGVLPLFDYLFGTATRTTREAQQTLMLGLKPFREADSTRLDRLLLMPFSTKFVSRPE